MGLFGKSKKTKQENTNTAPIESSQNTPNKNEVDYQETFLMRVEDVFLIKNHGTVVTGRIIKGDIRHGDFVYINGLRHRIIKIEIIPRQVTYAKKGDNVALHLDAHPTVVIEHGNLVTKEATPPPSKPKTFVCRCCGKEYEVKYQYSTNLCCDCNNRISAQQKDKNESSAKAEKKAPLNMGEFSFTEADREAVKRMALPLIPQELKNPKNQQILIRNLSAVMNTTMIELDTSRHWEMLESTMDASEENLKFALANSIISTENSLSIFYEPQLRDIAERADLNGLLKAWATLDYYAFLYNKDRIPNILHYRDFIHSLIIEKQNELKEKLAAPAAVSGCTVNIDSKALMMWLQSNPPRSVYELTSVIRLSEKEPTIILTEDNVVTRRYTLGVEANEDFTDKYFHISIRLSMQGDPAVPVSQIDGFISDTAEERGMTVNDIGYRFEGHFLGCGGENTIKRREINRGQDLPMKALKYHGYTTPSNVRLVGICPDCGKSFTFHGYAFYMTQSEVAYSDDGLDVCEIVMQNFDKDNWVVTLDNKNFRYYNSFCCPHCLSPYIDYKSHPENKVFGVSGCVHLGRKHYRITGDETDQKPSNDTEDATMAKVEAAQETASTEALTDQASEAVSSPAPEASAETAQAPQQNPDFIDDITFIRAIRHIRTNQWHQYDVLLASRIYGWGFMVDWADYLCSADIAPLSEAMTGQLGISAINITQQVLSNHTSFKGLNETSIERGFLSLAGNSKAISGPLKIVMLNQTNTLRLFALTDDETLIRKYVETAVRRTFNTENAMKLGKPIPQGQ